MYLFTGLLVGLLIVLVVLVVKESRRLKRTEVEVRDIIDGDWKKVAKMKTEESKNG